MANDFPPRLDGGRIYLTEAGTETEVLYKWGFELPEFAMFTLLDDPDALPVLEAMFCRYMETAKAHGTGMLLSGLDYRASADWGSKLGYDPAGLVDMQTRSIAFLQGIRDAYADSVPDTVISAILGPRGDAYGLNSGITAASAEAYHRDQVRVARQAGADMVCAVTFNTVAEATGAVRAAVEAQMPIGVYLTLDTTARLKSGPQLSEAIEEIDDQTQAAAAFFGINCSHPDEFAPALDGGAWEGRLRSMRPNASAMDKIALCKLGHLEDGDPEELGQQMGAQLRRNPGLDILGGCCGTDERHLAEIARNCQPVPT